MVGIVKRMRILRTLMDIRLGPGAAVISPDVKRIHLSFASKINEGHMGPRKFWHEYLPRLKYHNPAIPMTVERRETKGGPATLTIYFAPPSSNNNNASPAAPTSSTSGDTATSKHTPFENTKTIDMQHKKEANILAELLKLTDGKPIIATSEDEEVLKTIAEERERSREDRARQAEFMKAQKREAELLERAKRVSI